VLRGGWKCIELRIDIEYDAGIHCIDMNRNAPDAACRMRGERGGGRRGVRA